MVVVALYFKGIYLPSSTDSGASGNLIMDLYWGVELYPRLFWNTLDVKTFTNCRFGMMGWAVMALTFALKQQEATGKVADSMAVSVALQLIYIAKFYWWETGYWQSIDIMHDRAGYMICWGCLVWVPSVYTSPGQYLAGNRARELGAPLAGTIFVLGLVAIFLNFHADWQKKIVRASNGKALIYGRPVKLIRAKYTTATGEVKESILLASGWWGVVRHFNYAPELAAAFLWSAPCGFRNVRCCWWSPDRVATFCPSR